MPHPNHDFICLNPCLQQLLLSGKLSLIPLNPNLTINDIKMQQALEDVAIPLPTLHE